MGRDGRARIGGLGAAFAPSTIPAEDIVKSFHGVLAPEITEPWKRGPVDAGSAVACDVFAFAFLVVEVGRVISDNETLSETGFTLGFPWETPFRLRGCLFCFEWLSAGPTKRS